MRDIPAKLLSETVERLFLEANYVIPSDILRALTSARESEPSPVGQATLDQIIENDHIAQNERVAICQDTGMAIVFLDIGQDAHIVGGDLTEAVNAGVRAAYEKGYLRKSVVAEPLFERVNTGDNTPAVLHIGIVPGDSVRIRVTAKGFGSENMSRLAMLVPAQGVAGVKAFVIETAALAGPNACPPLILGVGVGGTMELAARMAKECLLRGTDERHPDPRYAALEQEILGSINALGVGPGGMGGQTTAIAVHIACAPTHIAGLPVAVNVCCHAARHAEANL